MATRRLPTLVAHADWGSKPIKRWMAVARLTGNTYELDTPELVGDVPSLLTRLDKRVTDGGPFVIGFDFPIGVPVSYARCSDIARFVDELPKFGSGRWSQFYELAISPAQISPHRPFYPSRPGGTSQQALALALGMRDIQHLLRVCEHGDAHRGDAAVLFWTLGPKQVGRAAIIGWRDVIAPSLRQKDYRVAVWPFDGEFDLLLQQSRCVIVETYPAEACLHLGLAPPGRGWSKRCQADRRGQGDGLLLWARKRGVTLSERLRTMICDGFGAGESAEDPFDAVLGLMSMIEVLLGHRSPGRHPESAIREVEGWIFGQELRGGS